MKPFYLIPSLIISLSLLQTAYADEVISVSSNSDIEAAAVIERVEYDPTLFGPYAPEAMPVTFSIQGEDHTLRYIDLVNQGGEIDPSLFYKYAPEVSRLALDAKLNVDDNGNLVIEPEKNGIKIDSKQLKKEIQKIKDDYDFSKRRVSFDVIPPRIYKADLESVLPEIEPMLSKQIELRTNDETVMYTFNLKDHFDMLDVSFESFVIINGRRFPVSLTKQNLIAASLLQKEYSIDLNPEAFSMFVDSEIAPHLEIEPQDVTITIELPEGNEPTTETDEFPEYLYDATFNFEGTAQNGIKIDRDVLKAEVMHKLTSEGEDSHVAYIPLSEVKGKVHAPDVLMNRGIKELFSTGYSNFAGSSWKRVHNIEVGIDRFNGVIIPKGTTFSFNERLGPVDASTGYLEELVIKGDRTEPDYGGGLCQVSSTFFRAGLYGGLDIIERRAHSYAVSYYSRPGGHGLDCTIYPGVADCKIHNDTDGDLLIQAYTDGSDAYFKFYGTHDGRSVSMDGPYYSNRIGAPADKIIYDPSLPEDYYKVQEQPHNGFDAVWYRTLVNADGEESVQTYNSRYQARPKVIIRGGTKPEENPEQIAEL